MLILNPHVYLGTIAELTARKQSYKLSMFRKLHIILILAVLIVVGFFVVTSMSFSSRYEEGPYCSSHPLREFSISQFRLRCQDVAIPVVAHRWLSFHPLLCCLRGY